MAKPSVKPSKVRKRMFNAPNHIRSKFLSAPLSPELREKYGRRSVRVRVGDSVKILRGEFSGVEGKVTAVYPDEGRLAVEGVTREKIAGGTVPVKIHASKVMVTSLDLGDKWRKARIEGGAKP
jgi:large subunit ribosomal protein L24